jgi:hypothetical protein
LDLRRYELQDVPVLLDATTKGVAAINHDAYGTLTVNPAEREPTSHSR